MGNIHFKRDSYGWGDTFYIYDESGNKKYYVKSSILLWSRKFVICDLKKKPLVEIKNNPKSLIKKKFDIMVRGEHKASVTKEISIIPKYIIDGLDWEFQGMGQEFKVTSGSYTIMTMSEDDTSWGYHPILTYLDTIDELLAIAMGMTLGYVVYAEEGKESTNYL